MRFACLFLCIAISLIGCDDTADADSNSAPNNQVDMAVDVGLTDMGVDFGLDLALDMPPSDMGEDMAVEDMSRQDMNIDMDRPDIGTGPGGSIAFHENTALNQDYGVLTDLPANFGAGEFTVDFWIKPDASFPFGSTADDNKTNWTSEDPEPYSSGSWWYNGNFLIDGHNNSSFDQGTFSVQFYGSGRLRWQFGDGLNPPSGGSWTTQAWPATDTPNIVDDGWHHVSLVRRFNGQDVQIELWVDGTQIDVQVTAGQVDMTQFWSDWSAFPGQQPGWFFGAEKQAAIGSLQTYEDYKGLFGELRLWDYARTNTELSNQWRQATMGDEQGLVGYFRFDEQAGSAACDSLDRTRCINFFNTDQTLWVNEGPVLE